MLHVTAAGFSAMSRAVNGRDNLHCGKHHCRAPILLARDNRDPSHVIIVLMIV